MEALRSALISLAGGRSRSAPAGTRCSGPGETVTVIGYADRGSPGRCDHRPDNPGASLARIRPAVRRPRRRAGNTATYSALREAYRVADRQIRDNPDALTSIVLMTDGEQNRGISEAAVPIRFYRGLRSDGQGGADLHGEVRPGRRRRAWTGSPG